MAVDDALRAMTNRNFDIGGVTPDPPRQFVSSKELQEAIREGRGGDMVELHAISIPASQCVEKSLPIASLLEIFEIHERLFVLDGNSVRWVITHADLVAPAVGVAVLSYLTVIESGLKLLGSILSDEQVKSLLPSGRLTKIQKVFDDLVKDNRETTFRDCLFLEDWLTVSRKTAKICREVGFTSGKALSLGTSSFGKVRNDLAHGRSLLADTNKTVAEVLARVRRIREFSTAVWRAVEHRRPIWDAYASTIISITEPKHMHLTGADATTDWPFEDRVFTITAWNPGMVWASAEKNKVANRRLRESLVRRGASIIPVVGFSTDREWSEESFLVEGLQAGQVAELAALFGQVAFFELNRASVKVCDSQTMDVVRTVDRRHEALTNLSP
jgi:hypothetical protein